MLAGICQHPSIYPAGLSSSHFSTKEGQKLFRELESFRGCEVVDEHTLVAEAGVEPKIANDLELVKIKTALQAMENCRMLDETVAYQELLQQIRQVAAEAYKSRNPIDFFAAGCESAFSKVRIDSAHAPLSFKDLIKAGLEDQKMIVKHQRLPAYTTGIKSLDARIGGFREDELLVLAAEAGAGKSTLALWFARHVAAEHGRVLFFSAEMTSHQMAERGAKAEMRLPMIGKTPTLANIEDTLLRVESDEIIERINFDFKPRYKMADVLSLGKHFNKDGDLKLIIFDHLRKWEPSRKTDNEIDRTSVAIEEAKETAKILRVPVLMLTHLSRSRTGADRPNVTMIRQSGKIEDEADLIVMLWPRRHPNGERSSETEIWIEKSRQGGNLGPVTVHFDPETQGFIEAF